MPITGGILYHSDQPGGGLVYDKKIRANDSGGGPNGGDSLARTAAPNMVTQKRPSRCHRPKKK